MKRILLSALVTISGIVNAQSNSFWTSSSDADVRPSGKRQIIPVKYKTVRLNGNALHDVLFNAPGEKSVLINQSNCIISLPLPNGKTEQFRVVESPIMEPALAASHPDIKTYSIKGIDDPYANGKLDWTEFGFHGMVKTPSGDFFIDPYCVGNTSHYITYYTRDFVKNPSDVLPEAGLLTEEPANSQGSNFHQENSPVNKGNAMPTCVGTQLKSYRLAIACTGQYAQAATGLPNPTNAQVLAKVVTSVNRVDGVYETEVSVRLILVNSTTLTLYNKTNTNTVTPYPPAPTATAQPFAGNANANTLINESQNVITALIGSANYDIGHTFSTGGGGLAFLGCVCSNTNKARGITGSPSPVGDPYDIDYVAHEVGHQFRGNHTFNNNSSGSCFGNRNGSTAVEPGSGVTIMGYAGICGAQDLATNSIPYFHAISYDEIINFVNNLGGASCAVTLTTGNQPPSVVAPGNFTIPKSTPFVLTGSATDPDSDPLTYSWEENDPGPTSGNWNSGNKPFFRSYNPVTSPTRYFPNQQVVASGNYTNTKGEYLPSTSQTMNFRLTARDNKMGGGGVCSQEIVITVDGGTGPFEVAYPSNAGITWYQGTQETITWNVNGTNVSPVSCDTVRILISIDNGNTYNVITNSTPNDGSQLISVPTVTTTENFCLIKVEGKGNVFYDISNNVFTISNILGLNKVSAANPVELNMWPNPTSNELTVSAGQIDSKHPVKISVLDVLGKVISEVSVQASSSEFKHKMNVSDLSKGIYFIKLENNGHTAVQRLVKE